jgi:hypothetical protein
VQLGDGRDFLSPAPGKRKLIPDVNRERIIRGISAVFIKITLQNVTDIFK